jgi:hypothetical protein
LDKSDPARDPMQVFGREGSQQSVAGWCGRNRVASGQFHRVSVDAIDVGRPHRTAAWVTTRRGEAPFYAIPHTMPKIIIKGSGRMA